MEELKRWLLFLLAALWNGGLCVDAAGFADLPRLSIKASTHYDFGLQTGINFRDEILAAVRSSSFFMEHLLPFNVTEEGAELYSRYHDIAAATFTDYLEEIKGMAEGAKLSYSELFLWNMQFEYHLLLAPKVGSLPPPSCSDFYLINGRNMTLLGHNEDGAVVANTTSYIIDAELTVDGEESERFTSFCYAGQLCSTAFGYSESARKVFSCNALFPRNVYTKSVGRNFLNRALMNKKLNEVASFLSQYPCSSGFSYNVATLDGLKVMNFEVSPSGVVATEIKEYDYHFNMYLHSDVAQYDDPSSDHRLTRVKQLAPPTSGADVLKLLGDTEDTKYPIYRTATLPDGAATLATALFDIGNSTFYIYRGNPALARQPVITIQMK